MRTQFIAKLGLAASALGLTFGCVSTAETARSVAGISEFETPFPEYGYVIGPDGAYVTRHDSPWATPGQQQILYAANANMSPRPPVFSDTNSNESDFYFSEQLQRGCFVSDRDAASLPSGTNIWCVEWSDENWGAPYPLPAPINSSASEFSPVLRRDGSIYFASDREGGAGLGDIYIARPIDGAWTIERPGDAINSKGGEWNLDVSPDGTTMIFEASHRETNVSVSGDLYLSRKVDGAWQTATPLTAYNTKGSELMARFTDDETFIYAQSIDGDVVLKIGAISANP